MDMIEKVARAMAENAGFKWEHCAQSQWRSDARAGINAMREPNNDMICGALQASLDIMKEKGVDALSPFKDYPPPGEVTKRCYGAMIDAALEQKPIAAPV